MLPLVALPQLDAVDEAAQPEVEVEQVPTSSAPSSPTASSSLHYASTTGQSARPPGSSPEEDDELPEDTPSRDVQTRSVAMEWLSTPVAA